MVGIVSTFTVAECLAVLALAAARRSGTPPTLQQIAHAHDMIMRFVRAAGLELRDSDALCISPEGSVNAFARVLQMELTTQPVQGEDGEWRGLGGADALHVAFAERSDCDDLASHDQGFRSMQSSVSFLSLGRA